MNLQEKIAVVRGASRAIGKAVATRLASEGAAVVIGYLRDEDSAHGLVSELISKGLKATAFCADVSKTAGSLALMDHAAKVFGRVVTGNPLRRHLNGIT
jgi:3-oxoacyl-[acyl-carrier protein] reductase